MKVNVPRSNHYYFFKWLSEIKWQFIFVNKATFVFFLNKHKLSGIVFLLIIFVIYITYILCNMFLVRDRSILQNPTKLFSPDLNLWLNRPLEFWLNVSTVGFVLDHWLLLAFLPLKTASSGYIFTDIYQVC